MLYKYRIKNCKDYYNCQLEKIIKAFNKCIDSIKCIEQDEETYYKITYIENKLNKIYNSFNISTID
jgi:hypothetical protein